MKDFQREKGQNNGHYYKCYLTALLILVVQSNMYIMALYIAVTLCITVTEQLPKNCPLYLLLS